MAAGHCANSGQIVRISGPVEAIPVAFPVLESMPSLATSWPSRASLWRPLTPLPVESSAQTYQANRLTSLSRQRWVTLDASPWALADVTRRLRGRLGSGVVDARSLGGADVTRRLRSRYETNPGVVDFKGAHAAIGPSRRRGRCRFSPGGSFDARRCRGSFRSSSSRGARVWRVRGAVWGCRIGRKDGG